MVKAIIFDMGGVLVDLDKLRCVKNFKERAGLDRIEEILDCYHQRGFFHDLEGGRLTLEEFYAEALKLCRPGATAEDIKECFCSLLVRVPKYKADLLNELKENYDLYILSNNNPITTGFAEGLFEAAGAPYSVFKELFISSEMKLQKPSEEIFNKVIRRVGCAPEEILFIDDSRINADAASALGIRGVYYDPATENLRDTVFSNL